MENNSNYNIGFIGLLTLLFIALKLCGVITWSWWWVLSPIWISVGLILTIFVLVGLFWMLAFLLKG